MQKSPVVFISYNSSSSSRAAELAEQLEGHAVVQRYETDVEDSGSFDSYMMGIRSADYIISIISKDYLFSAPCMYEAAIISDMLDRVAFVVENSATNYVYSIEGRVEIATYWVSEEAKIRQKIFNLPETTRTGFERDIKRLEAIRDRVSIFLEKVSDTKNTASYRTVMTIMKKIKHFREDSIEVDTRNAILSIIYDNIPEDEKIIYNAKENGTIKRSDIEALTGEKKAAALKRIRALMDSGVLVRVGNGSRTEYAVYSKEIVNTCI